MTFQLVLWCVSVYLAEIMMNFVSQKTPLFIVYLGGIESTTKKRGSSWN